MVPSIDNSKVQQQVGPAGVSSFIHASEKLEVEVLLDNFFCLNNF